MHAYGTRLLSRNPHHAPYRLLVPVFWLYQHASIATTHPNPIPHNKNCQIEREGDKTEKHSSLVGPLLEEVVALIIHHDESREVLDVNLPHSLHAELGVLKHLDLLDAVLGKDSCGPTDGAQVEALVVLAGLGHGLAAVALGKRDHAATVLLEEVDIRVHAAGSGGTKRARGHAGGGLCWASIVDNVVLDVLGQALAGIDPLLELGVGNVTCHHQGTAQRQAGLDRVLAQLLEDVCHGLVEVHIHHVTAKVRLRDLGQVLCWVCLEGLNEHTFLGHLAQSLTIGTARHTNADRAGGAVAGQTDDSDIVGKVLAAKLRTNAGFLAQLVNLLLELNVPESPAEVVAGSWQVIIVSGRAQLDGLQVLLGRHATHHDAQVVGGAGRRAQRLDLLVQELHEGCGVEQGLGLLEQERLVG
eukprot:comp11521_c0_seq1/m.5971 comp11521_c0_seq1/g.5971  ORF comp11521_c0_seq1/g.5971 comp11521_c0_seq1/m.5971 type:complete len:414 (+) comp11521_c0_seq1:338-1579(+)